MNIQDIQQKCQELDNVYTLAMTHALGPMGKMLSEYADLHRALSLSVKYQWLPGEISPTDFEDLSRYLFLYLFDYTVRSTRLTGDGGIDLILGPMKTDETHIVQCKYYGKSSVGVPAVKEFYGTMKAHLAAKGFFVTSAEFTEAARQFVQQIRSDTDLSLGATPSPILIPGTVLDGWIRQLQGFSEGMCKVKFNTEISENFDKQVNQLRKLKQDAKERLKQIEERGAIQDEFLFPK